MSKLWLKYENWSKHSRVYRYRSDLYRYRFGSGGLYRYRFGPGGLYRYRLGSGGLYWYRFKLYRYRSPKNAQNVCFSFIVPYVDTQINPILHKHVKTTPNSSYNLFSTQIIIQYISFIKTFHDFLPKTTLIWVITHTHTKYKNLLGFVLTQTPLLCN